jgi:uncharacterized protein (TIGR01777 family)
MKIFITGGTGFFGRTLTHELARAGHTVTILTRHTKKAAELPQGAFFFLGNPMIPGEWQDKLREHDATINLAGASIFTRWTHKTKREILESRILTTQNIVQSLSLKQGEKSHLINASAVGYYGFHGDEHLDETYLPGDGFLAALAAKWEDTAKLAKRYGVRTVLCRFGIILGKQGGALGQMRSLFRKGLGARFGSGEQWFSWVHEQDLVKIIMFLLRNKNLHGPVNCTAPHPVTNRELTSTLYQVLHKRPIAPFVPGLGLRLFLGEFSTTLLKGQRAIPEKLLNAGFSFSFPYIHQALQDLLR